MTEEIKGLIEKIQQEGIRAGEDKAKEIEAQARGQAEEILRKAREEAGEIISQAKEKSAKTEEAGRASLKQVARDTLLNLKKEINTLLDKLILVKVKEALSPQELTKLISSLIKEEAAKDKGGIIISLKKEDLEKMEKGFLSELREQAKTRITLRPSEDISGGFTISYDSGKSHFDFTDKALAEYLGAYAKLGLAELLKEISS